MTNLLESLKSFFRISFVKDTAIMQVGAVFMTGVSILASVIFARVLLPEKYGIYSLVFAFAGLISLFMNWGVDRAALVLLARAYEKKDRQEIKNILVYFMKVTLVVAIAVGGLGIIISPFLSEYFYRSSYVGELARMIILAEIFGLFFEMTSVTFQVLRKIKNYVILDNLRNLLRVGFGVILVFGFGVFGVMFGHLSAFFISFLLAVILYYRLASRNELLPSIGEILSGLKETRIKKYFNFGISIAVNQNISRLYSILPVIFLSMFYSSANVGYFNIALKYVSLPLMLVSPVGQLLSSRLPQLKASENPLFARNFYKASIFSGMIVLVLIVPALVLAPFLVKFFYGQEYAPAVKVIYYLVPFSLVSGFAVGLGALFRTLNKMKAIIIIDSFVVGLGIFPMYWLIKTYGLLGGALSTVLWYGVSDLAAFIYIRKFLK